jgi:hypothetical protein
MPSASASGDPSPSAAGAGGRSTPVGSPASDVSYDDGSWTPWSIMYLRTVSSVTSISKASAIRSNVSYRAYTASRYVVSSNAGTFGFRTASCGSESASSSAVSVELVVGASVATVTTTAGSPSSETSAASTATCSRSLGSTSSTPSVSPIDPSESSDAPRIRTGMSPSASDESANSTSADAPESVTVTDDSRTLAASVRSHSSRNSPSRRSDVPTLIVRFDGRAETP